MSIKRLTKHAKDKPMVETITQPTVDDLYELFSDVDIVEEINTANSDVTIGDPTNMKMTGLATQSKKDGD